MMNDAESLLSHEVHRLLVNSSILECVICGAPTLHKQVWLPEPSDGTAGVEEKPLRCVLYGVCEGHAITWHMQQWLDRECKKNFN